MGKGSDAFVKELYQLCLLAPPVFRGRARLRSARRAHHSVFAPFNSKTSAALFLIAAHLLQGLSLVLIEPADGPAEAGQELGAALDLVVLRLLQALAQQVPGALDRVQVGGRLREVLNHGAPRLAHRSQNVCLPQALFMVLHEGARRVLAETRRTQLPLLEFRLHSTKPGYRRAFTCVVLRPGRFGP